MVQTMEGTFASVAHDGAAIHTKAWLPDESAPPVAVVVWSHGVHEHLGRFERLYERFARARIATYAWDHVGHGKSGLSGGKRHQFAAGFDAVVADAVQFARSVRAKYPSTVPVFLGGVSFGGLVAAHACLSTPDARWAGLLLAAPAVDVKWNPALRLQASVGAFLARLAPHFRGVAAVPPERLSRDPDAIREYVEDPLVRVANVRFLAGFEILQGFRGLAPRREEIRTPLIVFHGDEDEACDFDVAREFVDAVGSDDKRFVALPGTRHLLLHEPGADAVMDEMTAWVESRAARWKTETGARAGGGEGAQPVLEHASPRL